MLLVEASSKSGSLPGSEVTDLLNSIPIPIAISIWIDLFCLLTLYTFNDSSYTLCSVIPHS